MSSYNLKNKKNSPNCLILDVSDFSIESHDDRDNFAEDSENLNENGIETESIVSILMDYNVGKK